MKKGKNTAITQAMAKFELNQVNLAEKTELHLTHINAVVNGAIPKMESAFRIARVLECTVDELFGHLIKWMPKEDEENERSNVDGD